MTKATEMVAGLVHIGWRKGIAFPASNLKGIHHAFIDLKMANKLISIGLPVWGRTLGRSRLSVLTKLRKSIEFRLLKALKDFRWKEHTAFY